MLSSTGIILETNFFVLTESFFQCFCFSKSRMTGGDEGLVVGKAGIELL